MLTIVMNACYTLEFSSVRVLQRSGIANDSKIKSKRLGFALTIWLSAVAPVTRNPSFSPLLKISKSYSQQSGVARSKHAEAL